MAGKRKPCHFSINSKIFNWRNIMAFVKRADGLTYYEGGHAIARKIGGEKKSM